MFRVYMFSMGVSLAFFQFQWFFNVQDALSSDFTHSVEIKRDEITRLGVTMNSKLGFCPKIYARAINIVLHFSSQQDNR